MQDDLVKRVLLCRSAMTPWDLAGRISGAADLAPSEESLSEWAKGLGQAEAGRLTAVVCGPDEASVTCARILSDRLGGRVRVLKSLREPSLGLWEGRTPEELAEKSPRVFRQWQEDPASVIPPQGESWEDARTRILHQIARTLTRIRSGERIGVVVRPLAAATIAAAAGHDPEPSASADAWTTPHWLDARPGGLLPSRVGLPAA